MTKIEWTDATWNPVTGCTKVSPGCAHCYAERLTLRFGGKPFLPGQAEIKLHEDRLTTPLRWKKPRMIFVNSMSDLFHDDVPDEFIAAVWYTMAATPQHTYQILTKRPERMESLLSRTQVDTSRSALSIAALSPLSNVWLGVSVENQRWADARIPLLLETPAAVRFLSCEPLLGPLDITPFLAWDACVAGTVCGEHPRPDWVIVGGESGGPEGRRLVDKCVTDSGMPFHRFNVVGQPDEVAGRVHKPCGGTGWRPKPDALEWVRSIRDQCAAVGVPFFFKQFGGPRPTSSGRELDGRTWDEMPGE